MKLLLIACSARKHPYLNKGKARFIYVGRLFCLSLRLAEENGYIPWILSARYGFIRPDDVIQKYNTRFTSPYSGPWPEGSGYYVGGSMYFSQAPDRFLSLAPKGTFYEGWVKVIRNLCMDPRPPSTRLPVEMKGLVY